MLRPAARALDDAVSRCCRARRQALGGLIPVPKCPHQLGGNAPPVADRVPHVNGPGADHGGLEFRLGLDRTKFHRRDRRTSQVRPLRRSAPGPGDRGRRSIRPDTPPTSGTSIPAPAASRKTIGTAGNRACASAKDSATRAPGACLAELTAADDHQDLEQTFAAGAPVTEPQACRAGGALFARSGQSRSSSPPIRAWAINMGHPVSETGVAFPPDSCAGSGRKAPHAEGRCRRPPGAP